jgi:predicted LPLAT superfamily acyltransferase
MGEILRSAIAVAVFMILPSHVRKTSKEYSRAYFRRCHGRQGDTKAMLPRSSIQHLSSVLLDRIGGRFGLGCFDPEEAR